MPKPRITKPEARLIRDLVAHFEANKSLFDRFVEQLIPLFTNAARLSPLIHSMKWRVKQSSHLKDKLERKLLVTKAKGTRFSITKENLFYEVNDLAGFRLIHLHTRQMKDINEILLELFDEELYELREGPIARTWDDESRTYFEEIGITTAASSSLYTSVHYILQPNRKTKYTCEIQVRTLMEEVWGEVSHKINYPTETQSVACQEQLKVLARFTSGCSRLVDSIFKSDEDHSRQAIHARRKRAPRRS
jgi:ppGpp synthetase/RelA/SpoT-type nucleotidyltranferase